MNKNYGLVSNTSPAKSVVTTPRYGTELCGIALKFIRNCHGFSVSCGVNDYLAALFLLLAALNAVSGAGIIRRLIAEHRLRKHSVISPEAM